MTPTPTTPPEPAPNAELLSSLGRLVRGLSALFWGLPVALIVCAQTAMGDWLQPLGIVPPLLATALLVYGLGLLGHFQKQERVWRIALDRARIFAVVNVGLSPFLYWWHKFQSQPFYNLMLEVMILTGVLFLFTLNPVLWRLAAMLPDETLRLETKLFTTLNRYLLLAAIILLAGFFVLSRFQPLPSSLNSFWALLRQGGPWIVLFLILLPLAMTMASIWKIKEVILASVFGAEH